MWRVLASRCVDCLSAFYYFFFPGPCFGKTALLTRTLQRCTICSFREVITLSFLNLYRCQNVFVVLNAIKDQLYKSTRCRASWMSHVVSEKERKKKEAELVFGEEGLCGLMVHTYYSTFFRAVVPVSALFVQPGPMLDRTVIAEMWRKDLWTNCSRLLCVQYILPATYSHWRQRNILAVLTCVVVMCSF